VTEELVALLDGKEVGRAHMDRGRLAFVYDDEWRNSPGAYPLSLSMPLAGKEHGRAVVEAYLWGLLPDNAYVLDRWAAKFQVSARNPFALISHVGEDCAGAVQFVSPDRLGTIRGGTEDKVEWLDEADVARRLQALRADHAAWRLPRDTGQFSLAGARPKTALLLQNEHLCLMLARAVGLPAARSQVMRFGDEIATVIERYDRLHAGNAVVRVHQEDICQALGIMPTRKYQNEGGPNPFAIADLLRTYSSSRATDVDTFIAALAFNWLIAGTDAHAKNFSLLLGTRRVRLAPLYDVASNLPHDEFDLRRLKLAMKVGGEYKLSQIGLRQWQKFARKARVNADQLIERLTSMAKQIPDEATSASALAREEGLDATIVERLTTQLIERARACETALAGTQPQPQAERAAAKRVDRAS
jgi:serine/threonine-protein kinase HipA